MTAATISWRMKKNGTSLASSSISVGANTYYTLNCFFNTFVVGDVLTVSLWSNKTDSNWDYNAYQVQPSRITPDETNIVFLSFGSPGSFPTLASGNSHADYSGASVFYINGTLNARSHRRRQSILFNSQRTVYFKPTRGMMLSLTTQLARQVPHIDHTTFSILFLHHNFPLLTV